MILLFIISYSLADIQINQSKRIINLNKSYVSHRLELESGAKVRIKSHKQVNFDILKHKYVLLLISGPDVSENVLLTLKQLHQEIGNRGKIVWIPIVGQATLDMERKFRSRGTELPLYIVHKFSPIPGIKFIREEWHFRHEALLVVINPKVRVEQCILLEQIKDINSFPCFRKKRIDVLVDGISRCACHCLCVHVPTSKCCQRH